jgi:undecaprenyl-diphosphatase
MNSHILLFANKIDLDVIGAMSSFVTPFGVKVALFVSNIGSPYSFLLLAIAAVMIFWLYKKPYYLIQFIVTLGVGYLSVYVLKILIAKPRPVAALIQVGGYSFPSGHATVATLFCSLLIFAYKDHIKNVFLRLLFIIILSISALAISFSRVYLSVHYLSDVVVGIILGLLISSLSVFIFENFFRKKELNID